MAPKNTGPTLAMARSALSSVFGKCETECAAYVVVDRAYVARTWDVTVRPSDFATDRLVERGFEILVQNGLLVRSDLLSDDYRPTDRFVEAIETRYDRYADTRPLLGASHARS